MLVFHNTNQQEPPNPDISSESKSDRNNNSVISAAFFEDDVMGGKQSYDDSKDLALTALNMLKKKYERSYEHVSKMTKKCKSLTVDTQKAAE